MGKIVILILVILFKVGCLYFTWQLLTIDRPGFAFFALLMAAMSNYKSTPDKEEDKEEDDEDTV